MADSDSFTTARNEQSTSRPIPLQRPRSSIQTAQSYAKKLNPFIKMIATGMIVFIFISNLIKPASDSCAQSPLASSQNKEMMNTLYKMADLPQMEMITDDKKQSNKNYIHVTRNSTGD
ncbi:MAG: hypothetical protein FD143_3621 [Ignavibacteria bacterium]|nr:MAG: hypothetical protein FD143_3621 [Ignavibacteria bacterium]